MLMGAAHTVGPRTAALRTFIELLRDFDGLPGFVEELGNDLAHHLFVVSRQVQRQMSLASTEQHPRFDATAWPSAVCTTACFAMSTS